MIKHLVVIFLSFGSITNAATETKEEEDARRRVSGEIPLVARDQFEDQGRRIGGATFSSGLFKERSTGKHWIGKSPTHIQDDGTVERGNTESNVCREKISSDIYATYGVTVPKTVLSLQRTTNTGIDEYNGHEVMHIMSQLVEGYHDYKTQIGFTTFKDRLHPRHGPIVAHDDACSGCVGPTRTGFFSTYKTEGLGRIAAIATWLVKGKVKIHQMAE